jgi:hypothetical protein
LPSQRKTRKAFPKPSRHIIKNRDLKDLGELETSGAAARNPTIREHVVQAPEKTKFCPETTFCGQHGDLSLDETDFE